MASRIVSTNALLCAALLNSHQVLRLVQRSPFRLPISADEMREAVFHATRHSMSKEPSHLFDAAWKDLQADMANKNRDWFMPGALHMLAAEHLQSAHGRLHVQMNKFGIWQQSIVSRLSCVPVCAAAYVWPADPYTPLKPIESKMIWGAKPKHPWAHEKAPFLLPYEQKVEEYIRREGLHETHVHLNGSTSAEQCWLLALHDPTCSVRKFDEVWHNKKLSASKRVREFAHSIQPSYSPFLLLQQLRAARRLRELLVAVAECPEKMVKKLPPTYRAMMCDKYSGYGGSFACKGPFYLHKNSNCFDEMRWQKRILEYLDKNRNQTVERMLHCYLLLQNLYYRLLVQHENQFGFSEFQKLTLTDLRDYAEQEYYTRFRAMHGPKEHSRIHFLDARIAPKDMPEKNVDILLKVLRGYHKYLAEMQPPAELCIRTTKIRFSRNPTLSLSELLKALDRHLIGETPQGRRVLQLALTMHFIKQPWSYSDGTAGPYHFYSVRKDLEKKAYALVHVLRKWPDLAGWVRAIDAAANEMDTPPEVFASCFRLCRMAGISRRTFHVGEDFPHLLNGMRTILDAVELLQLEDGDRIGHGTALGIKPELWIQSMPEKVSVSRGEWLLDLLAARRLLMESDCAHQLHKIDQDIAKHASYIFGKELSCTAIERAMKLRHLNLGCVHERLSVDRNTSPCMTFSSFLREEREMVYGIAKSQKADLELLWQWQQNEKFTRGDSVMQRRFERIQVPADYLVPALLVGMQQALMRILADKKVLIETLPTSNVRISQYQKYKDHHAMRWMRVPGAIIDGDPAILTTLGSDDPGIFAGDLTAEFYHLYSELQANSDGESEPLEFLAAVNERGREYRFHRL